ncbi:hypothetical protein Acsp03_42700 [Actinomadura sp. NBRC 104412]|uniref:alpha/beta hydrolase family protein n=1 Tax=Actinomadura sp. NBRC 104412 TaxID=3032203 RepID=UPI0024A45AB9|nr:prolyl oligopeptidase family serine peptidase [Actinomadura sp. NBRC 104412]GLZ06804.1 hypothetical protein Acsp03_42700 [Actinomadura sp. NBRC 104412]
MSPERERRDEAPDGSAWAVVRTPALPSVAECNPAAVRWRDLLLDPDLAGLVPGRARPSSIVFYGDGDGDGADGWRLPLDGVLPSRLAWHPRRPLVAGLVARDRRAYPWIADHRDRTVTVLTHLRAAVSFTGYGLPPLAWCGDRLALLVPAAAPGGEPEPPTGRPVVFEASGPRAVSFEPPPGELERLAAARLAVVDRNGGEAAPAAPLTPPMLVRGLLPASADGAVIVGLGRWEDGGDGEPRWTDVLIDLDDPGRPRPVPDAAIPAPRPWPRPDGSPDAATPIPTGFGTARLTLPPAGPGPLLMWIRAFPPGSDVPCPAPVDLATAPSGHPVATLDLPLRWPADATLGMLRSQILGTVEAAVKRWNGPVAVGGHSFAATLALYALAHLPDLTSAIVHSGCYNRTLTPTGFHYERRPYWAVPEIYHAFSAVCFADLLDRPVLLVHGAEDANPATPAERSVELYRAIVAAGGQARLVLLPHEGHHYRYRETHEAVAAEHRAWLGRW